MGNYFFVVSRVYIEKGPYLIANRKLEKGERRNLEIFSQLAVFPHNIEKVFEGGL